MEKQLLAVIALCFAGLSIIIIWKEPWGKQEDDQIMDGVDAPRALREHAELLNKEQIIKVIFLVLSNLV